MYTFSTTSADRRILRNKISYFVIQDRYKQVAS